MDTTGPTRIRCQDVRLHFRQILHFVSKVNAPMIYGGEISCKTHHSDHNNTKDEISWMSITLQPWLVSEFYPRIFSRLGLSRLIPKGKLNNSTFPGSFRTVYFLILLLISLGFNSCNAFEYSPFDEPVLSASESDLNQKNIRKISSLTVDTSGCFCFALMSDAHTEYAAMKSAANHINEDSTISFVIHLGDMTDGGLYKEYQWTNDNFSRLRVPCIMLIGNHDYLGNGRDIYRKMFGLPSFTFRYSSILFICFDDVIWENDNTYPDFDWLENTVKDSEPGERVLVLSHIPPIRDQFDDYCIKRFSDIITSAQIQHTFHGHVHHYSSQKYPESNSTFYTCTTLADRIYYKVHVTKKDVIMEPVNF